MTSNGYKDAYFGRWCHNLWRHQKMHKILVGIRAKKWFGNRVFRLDRISKCKIWSFLFDHRKVHLGSSVVIWGHLWSFLVIWGHLWSFWAMKWVNSGTSGQFYLNPNLWLVIKYFQKVTGSATKAETGSWFQEVRPGKSSSYLKPKWWAFNGSRKFI